MQIHELNTFSGTPGDLDFLALDNGFDTAKISANALLGGKLNKPENEGNPGQLLRFLGGNKTEWADYGLPTDEQTEEAINNWLDAHPEATTTVQDGSLTLPKFKPGELPFVTPEQFGAVGDGITDDTAAWQSAVDSGFNVKATKKSYKCGKIEVVNDITIDCNNASFLCTDIKLFDCHGEILDTLTGEADYTANNSYAISDSDYLSYSGFAMMRGDNNFEKSRSYYKGGFACEFYNGKLINPYPIAVTNPSIDIIKPIKVDILKIGGISHVDGSVDNYSIHILYGNGCTIKNSSFVADKAYICFDFEKSLNCLVDNCIIESQFVSSRIQTYIIAFLDSSFCSVTNSYIFNQRWHCITTGNIYLCYRNVIENCKLFSNYQYAYSDHENAVNTEVIRSICSGIIVSAGGLIEGCIIVPRKDNTYKSCSIRLMPASDLENAVYTVRNIKIIADSNSDWRYVGVELYHEPQETGYTYYFKSILFENVKRYNLNLGQFSFSLPTTSNYEVRDIIIDNTNLNIFLGKQSADTSISITNYKLYVRNIIERKTALNFALLGNSGYTFNDVDIAYSSLGSIKGVFNNLTFANLYIASTMAETDFSVSVYLGGHELKSRFTKALLESPTYLNISDMRYNDSNTYLNIYKNNVDGKAYAQKWSNGTMNTVEIPN